MPKLHILVDSREPSISFARKYLRDKDNFTLGRVEHIRGINLADRLGKLDDCVSNDEILISVHHLAEAHLQGIQRLLKQNMDSGVIFCLASYDCFPHIKPWCDKMGVRFASNPYKRRLDPEKKNDSSVHRGMKGPVFDQEMLDRIWAQYRLMLAIISRLGRLGDICRDLIAAKTVDAQKFDAKNMADEYARALRFFRLGEPDMAGGSYSGETNNQGSPNVVDQLRLRIKKIAATDFNVLVRGESGCGKEAIAWSIHELSARRDKPFMAINCAGLPDELLESEMFGYVKGSHTQATSDSAGLLETVSGGTLFLDELPEMSPRIQAKLLRFLESGEFRPLGGKENRYTDVRVVAAGQPGRVNDPERFRPDLKSRICQLGVDILPLREAERENPGILHRITKILLERYAWMRISYEDGIRELTPFDIRTFQDKLSGDENMHRLAGQDWKDSNIRELNNFLRQWIVFGDEELSRLDRPGLERPTGLGEETLSIHDEDLKGYLRDVQSRDELEALLKRNPYHNLKEAYVRHLFAIYSRIVDEENAGTEQPKKATQKELARLMGVTENTICLNLKSKKR